MVRISFAVYTTVSAATTGAKETSKASNEVKPIRIIVFGSCNYLHMRRT